MKEANETPRCFNTGKNVTATHISRYTESALNISLHDPVRLMQLNSLLALNLTIELPCMLKSTSIVYGLYNHKTPFMNERQPSTSRIASWSDSCLIPGQIWIPLILVLDLAFLKYASAI